MRGWVVVVRHKVRDLSGVVIQFVDDDSALHLILVVVQRTNLDAATDPAARQLALADNRIAELSLKWDPELLNGFAAKGIGRTFQNLALFKHGTVVENILTGRHTHLRSTVLDAVIFFGRTRREEIEARQRVEEIIEFLEIEHIRDAVVGTLSYGQQKRVELARALACEPKLLLLDEMVSGMNQEEREDIARFILDLKEDLGATVLMVEHDMGIVMDISDHVCVMNEGRKIAEGAPAQVAINEAVVAAYLGAKRAAA